MQLSSHSLSEQVGDARLLHEVSATLAPGTFTAVVGPNGAGKSTWLRALAGEPSVGTRSGDVQLGGRPLADWDPAALARARAVVSQRPEAAFALAAWELVALGRLPWRGLRGATPGEGADGARGPTRSEVDVISAALRRVGALDLADRPVNVLSGGEAARIHLARALAQLPPSGGWLLLDEPTAALDLAQAERTLALLRGLAGVGVVAVVHDLGQALRHAERVLVLSAGVLVADGDPAAVLSPKLIADVWGAEVQVVAGPDGRPVAVVPSTRGSRPAVTAICPGQIAVK